MLKLHLNTSLRPSIAPMQSAAASPAAIASQQLVRPVFYDATSHRRLAVEIASALVTVVLMILLTVFAISVSVEPHLPAAPLPKAAITRAVDGALVQADLLPARRATAGHTTARAQSTPAAQAQPAGPSLVSGYITVMP